MIETITVTNYRGDSLTMTLARPELSGLAVKNIDGLGASTSSINTTDFVGIDGSEFNSSRRQTRNIVMTIKPVPVVNNGILVGSVEESRRLTYKFFRSKKEVKLEFKTTFRKCYCTGYVESNESTIFSDSTENVISILCPDPNFYDSSGIVETKFTGITSLFALDIENTSELNPPSTPKKVRPISEVGKYDMVTGKIMKFTRMNVPYSGEIDVGITINIEVTQNNVTGIIFYNLDTYEEMEIYEAEIQKLTGSPLIQNDMIIIETSTSKKSVLLYRNATYYNIINCINRDADWFQLSQGDNLLAYTATTGLNDLNVRVDHLVAYEGV